MPIDSTRGQGPFRHGPTTPSAKHEAERDLLPYTKGADFPRLSLAQVKINVLRQAVLCRDDDGSAYQ